MREQRVLLFQRSTSIRTQLLWNHCAFFNPSHKRVCNLRTPQTTLSSFVHLHNRNSRIKPGPKNLSFSCPHSFPTGSSCIPRDFRLNSPCPTLPRSGSNIQSRNLATAANNEHYNNVTNPVHKMKSARDTLPPSVKPTHYWINLHDLQLGGDWSFQGEVKINIQVHERTKDIVLNSHQLKIFDVVFFPDFASEAGAMKAEAIKFDEAKQRATLSFPEALPISSSSLLAIRFQGTMNNSMTGFYRSRYKPAVTPSPQVPTDGEYHYMLSTQLESCSARTAFPCWDEPNLKATFDFQIEVPDQLTALSNMPEKSTTTANKQGWKVVEFERSPVMSTYLLAWAFGDFEYIEEFTQRKYNGKRLPVRVYTTRGLKEQGRFALENAHQVIDYFSDIFDIEYPLPKSDLLAVHEFSHGAMENWGLVTYRTSAVLFDDATSDINFKNRIAGIVSHELAHMWFGNLVTMDWWDELWLNEGFATWVGNLAVDHVHPTWDIWSRVVLDDLQMAFNLDSLRSSHAIEVPVKDALEVEQIFDAISYRKGANVLRMLSAYLSVPVFLKGVSNYLKAHKYANATTQDLWTALSETSGKDVNAFMDNWIRKIGFPVLTVAEEPGQIGVRQSRFLSTGDAKPEEDETVWWIPLGLKTATVQESKEIILTAKEETVRNVDDTFYKLNSDQTALYRTNYPPPRLQQLGMAREYLTVRDRIGLIADASALAASGDGTSAALLGLLEGFKSEENYYVWSQIVSSYGNMRSVFGENEKISAGLKKFILELISPAAEQIGWEFQPGEDFLTVQLRALLISTAGLAGHPGIVAEAQRRFALWATGQDRSAIHPNLRSAVWRIAISEGGAAQYEAVKREFLTTTSVDGRELALLALGRVAPALVQDYVAFYLSDAVAVQDVHSPAMALAANPRTRRAHWECLKGSYERVVAKAAGNPVVVDRFMRVSLNKFAERDLREDVARFFEGKDTKGWERTLRVVLDTVEGNVRYKERDEGLVLEWLEAHKYV